MNVKTLLLSAGLIAVMTLANSAADAAERKYSMSGFDAIRVGQGVNVVITTGTGPSAQAEADDRRILDRVSFDRSSRQLVVSMKRGSVDGSSSAENGPVTVYLTTYEVKELTHVGSGTVTLDELSGRQTRIRLGGFGAIAIGNVDSEDSDIALSGGGQVTMAGEIRKARVALIGSSTFDGKALMVERLTLTNRGASSSHVAVEREAKINNSGTGMIRIDGKPVCTIETDGAAEIICNPQD